MALKIIKRISLEFLGEEYKDSYLDFTSIPVKELSDIQKKAEDIEKSNDNIKSFNFIMDQITSRFVTGKIKQESGLVDVTREDLDDLPAEVLYECLLQLRGNLSPK